MNIVVFGTLVNIITLQVSGILINPCNNWNIKASNENKIYFFYLNMRSIMPAKLVDEEIIKQLSLIFDTQLEHPVEIILFYDNNNCASCKDTHHLLEEITALSENLYFS